MPMLPPEVLIARHIEKLRTRPDTQKIDQVLALAGLTVAGEHVTNNGRGPTEEDCRKYKHAVREIYGEATYAFTKVNFVLGGCACRDCTG